MTQASDNNNPLDLSALDFGPAWVRDNKSDHKHKRYEKGDSDRSQKQRKPKGKGEKPFRKDKRKDFRPQRERATLPEGIKASIMPIEEGVDNLAKEIVASGRTYSVFDLAKMILKSRERYNVAFTVTEGSKHSLYHSKADQATFLTQEECAQHFINSDKFTEYYEAYQDEVEAPKGNFPSIAVCGFTGKTIAPPNYHGYQTILTSLHEAEFSNMSLDRYKSRIQMEKDEEKVNAWIDSMKSVTKYKSRKVAEATFESKTEAWEHYLENGFKEDYIITKKAFVSSEIKFKLLSEGLASGLIEIIKDQGRYPGELSSFLCRQLSGRHLAVFKWQNKLHAGPSRPHQIPADVKIAERPQAILNWTQENSGKGIDELWGVTLPTDVTDEQKREWFSDLHWLINQGYLVLLENGKLHLSSDAKKK